MRARGLSSAQSTLTHSRAGSPVFSLRVRAWGQTHSVDFRRWVLRVPAGIGRHPSNPPPPPPRVHANRTLTACVGDEQALDKAQYRLTAQTATRTAANTTEAATSALGWQAVVDPLVQGLLHLAQSIGNQVASVDSDRRTVSAYPLDLPFAPGSGLDSIVSPPEIEVVGSAGDGPSALRLLSTTAAAAAGPRGFNPPVNARAQDGAHSRSSEERPIPVGVAGGARNIGVRLKLSHASRRGGADGQSMSALPSFLAEVLNVAPRFYPTPGAQVDGAVAVHAALAGGPS